MGWIKDIFDIFTAMIRSDISDRESLFRNHVDPLYEKLIKIHKDYINAFIGVRDKIKANSLSNEELISFLRDRKREYDLERKLAYALAVELKGTGSKRFSGEIGSAVEEYCHSICGYFSIIREVSINDSDSLPRISTAFSEMISLLEVKQGISEMLDFTIEEGLPQAFNKITSAYAKLKIILI